jgi:hypothetical protein
MIATTYLNGVFRRFQSVCLSLCLSVCLSVCSPVCLHLSIRFCLFLIEIHINYCPSTDFKFDTGLMIEWALIINVRWWGVDSGCGLCGWGRGRVWVVCDFSTLLGKKKTCLLLLLLFVSLCITLLDLFVCCLFHLTNKTRVIPMQASIFS